MINPQSGFLKRIWPGLMLGLAACASPPAPLRDIPPTPLPMVAPAPPAEPPSAVVRQLRDEAARIHPWIGSDLGRAFLAATENLANVAPRKVWQDPASRQYYATAGAAKLPDARQKSLVPVVLDEYRYYFTKYGSPLANVRALDLAATQGFTTARGARILDFGYGAIAHLRLLASLGAEVVGVDIDSYLAALYSEPEDQGKVPGHAGQPAGTVRLVHGRFPAEAKTSVEVGGGFGLIISKNTLKRGYIKPSRPADERQLIRLGTSDEIFLKALYTALDPGGLVVIYNLAPAPAPANKPYLPWADARSPWSQRQYQQAGFEVLALDANDDEFARALGRQLGWDKNDKGETLKDYEKNLFALYTILRRPRQPG